MGVLCWGRAECQRTERDEKDPSILGLVLKDLLPLIRVLFISSVKMATEVVPSKLLTAAEVVAALRAQADRSAPLPPILHRFASKQRALAAAGSAPVARTMAAAAHVKSVAPPTNSIADGSFCLTVSLLYRGCRDCCGCYQLFTDIGHAELLQAMQDLWMHRTTAGARSVLRIRVGPVGETDAVFVHHDIFLERCASAPELVSKNTLQCGAGRDAMELALPSLTATGLECLLQYWYIGAAKLTSDNVVRTFSAAKALGLSSLYAACVAWLRAHISPSNCCLWLEEVLLQHDEMLFRLLQTYFVAHLTEIARLDAGPLGGLSPNTLFYVLDQNGLDIPKEVCDSVL